VTWFRMSPNSVFTSLTCRIHLVSGGGGGGGSRCQQQAAESTNRHKLQTDSVAYTAVLRGIFDKDIGDRNVLDWIGELGDDLPHVVQDTEALIYESCIASLVSGGRGASERESSSRSTRTGRRCTQHQVHAERGI